jgi:hypothetical protein
VWQELEDEMQSGLMDAAIDSMGSSYVDSDNIQESLQSLHAASSADMSLSLKQAAMSSTLALLQSVKTERITPESGQLALNLMDMASPVGDSTQYVMWAQYKLSMHLMSRFIHHALTLSLILMVL